MPTSVNQHFFGIDTKLWIGVVEDRADPLQIGSARVRIHGYHTSDRSLLPTEGLPWATPLLPLTSGGVSGVGDTVNIMEGATVVGFWGDWPDCQVPIMFGIMNQIEGRGSTSGSASGNGGSSNSGGLHQSGNSVNDTTATGGPGTMNPTGDGPKWLQVARGEMQKGVAEWPGSGHNPDILKYGKDLGFNSEETPWCSAFARWCLKQAGCSVQGVTGWAKSFLKAPGYETLQTPIYGCIAVYHRGASSGHVGFWVGRDAGRDKILGGNQSDKVCITTMSTQRLAGYRWPQGQAKPGASEGGGTSNAVNAAPGSLA